MVANTAWVDARVYFERGPTLVRQVHPQQRARYLALAGRVALGVGRLGHPYFMEAAQALAEVDCDAHRELLELAEGIVPQSGVAAMEFVKSSPNVLRLLRAEDLPRWQEKGLEILSASVDGGEAFFRLESSKGEDIIESLSSRVELERVSELIRLYAKALTGQDLSVQSVENLTERGVGWVNESSPTTEGTAIFLPPMVETYQSKAENLQRVQGVRDAPGGAAGVRLLQFRLRARGLHVRGRRARGGVARRAATRRRGERGTDHGYGALLRPV